MQSPMQILQGIQGRNARSDLPMSNAASKQLGVQHEIVRTLISIQSYLTMIYM